MLRDELEKVSRDRRMFEVAKRVYVYVHEAPDDARTESHRWSRVVSHSPAGTDASGVHGTPEQVRERLEELVAIGANHLLLNPVCRHAEQLEALASIAGRS